jgi:hypothetical protein
VVVVLVVEEVVVVVVVVLLVVVVEVEVVEAKLSSTKSDKNRRNHPGVVA